MTTTVTTIDVNKNPTKADTTAAKTVKPEEQKKTQLVTKLHYLAYSYIIWCKFFS